MNPYYTLHHGEVKRSKRMSTRRSSVVERQFMARQVVESILMVDILRYFSFLAVLRDWYNKVRDMCYPVCAMMQIKDPLLLIEKSGPCGGGSEFLLSLFE